MTKYHKPVVGRVGVAVPPRRQHVIDLNSFAEQLLERKISPEDQPPICVLDRLRVGEELIKSHSPFADLRSSSSYPGGGIGFDVDNKDITSNSQVYSPNFVFDKHELGNVKDEVFIRHVNGSPQSTIWATPDLFMPLSRSKNFMQDECGNNESFFNASHGEGSVDNGKDDLESHSSCLLKRDDGSILDKVFKNCVIPMMP